MSLTVPLMLGCHEPTELPPVQLEGEFLAYAADDGIELCPGTVVQAEQWMAAVAERLGIDAQDIRPTTYFFVDEDVIAAECGKAGVHCTRREDDRVVVFSTELMNKHELVHVLHVSSWPDRSRLLQEGLAHGFDDRFPQHSFAPSAEALDAAVDDDSDTSRVTVIGGFFVTWLYLNYGAQALEQLWYASATPTTAAEFRADFEQVTGEELAAVFPAPDELGCPVMTCTGVLRPWVDGVWTTTSPDGCEDDSVVGSTGSDSYLVVRTDLLEITAGGDHEISVSAGASPGVQVTACDMPCDSLFVASGAVEAHYLAPGVYRVETAQWELHAPTSSVTIRPLG